MCDCKDTCCCVGGGGCAGVEPRRGEVCDGRQAAVHTANRQQLATRPHHQAEPHQRHARHAGQGEPFYHMKSIFTSVMYIYYI